MNPQIPQNRAVVFDSCLLVSVSKDQRWKFGSWDWSRWNDVQAATVRSIAWTLLRLHDQTVHRSEGQADDAHASIEAFQHLRYAKSTSCSLYTAVCRLDP